MIRLRKKMSFSGSITVFLAMVFLLILAVVLVTLESARVAAVKSYMSIALRQGMDSVLAKYYLPLFDEYELFGLYLGETTDSLRKEALEDKLAKELTYATNPLEGLSVNANNVFAVLPGVMEGIDIDEVTYLDDYDSDAFYGQAVLAAKYGGLQSIIDSILGGCNLLSDTATASKAYSMQSEVVEELSELDEITLQLMELIDGIYLTDGDLQVQEDGLLECRNEFVKQLISMPVSMETVAVNHAVVFESVKPYYYDKDSVYQGSIELIQQLIDLMNQREALESSLASLEVESLELEDSIESLTDQEDTISGQINTLASQIEELDREQDKEAIDALQASIDTIEQESSLKEGAIDQLREEQSRLQESMDKLTEDIEVISEEIHELYIDVQVEVEQADFVLLNCWEAMDEAIEVIEKGIQKQSEAQPLVREYESKVEEMKAELTSESETLLTNELETMKQYVGLGDSDSGKGSMNYDYAGMKQVIESNLGLLENQITYLSEVGIYDEIENLESALTSLKNNQEIISTYSIAGLEFDYSTLNLEQSSEKKVTDSVGEVLSSGLLDLVLGDDMEVSEQSIEVAGLPSTLAGVHSTNSRLQERVLQDSLVNQSAFGDLLDEFSSLFEGDSSLGEFASSITDSMFFQSYLQTFFKDFTEEENPRVKTVQYPSVLNYEKEYLCFHKQKDQDNLKAMVETIFLIRLVVSFIEVFSNPICGRKAQMTATALVAFTGLAFLVMITKLLILTAWAVVEALVDVAAILRGKELAIFDKTTMQVQYEELLTVNKTLIASKAKNYESDEGLAFGYDEYLFLVLLVQSKQSKCYSAMDLIQANLNYRYEGRFQINQCVLSFQSTLNYRVKNLYLGRSPFGDGLQFQKSVAMSY